MKQYDLKFYFRDDSDNYHVTYGYVLENYAKPSFLRKLAASKGALFVICEKYGCRQFLAE